LNKKDKPEDRENYWNPDLTGVMRLLDEQGNPITDEDKYYREKLKKIKDKKKKSS
jgi:hypothetical protein